METLIAIILALLAADILLCLMFLDINRVKRILSERFGHKNNKQQQ